MKELNLKKLIKKILSEEKLSVINEQVESGDYYLFKTATGGSLIIPKTSKPKIVKVVNKNLWKSALTSREKILDYASKSEHIKKACSLLYREKTFEECAAFYFDNYVNRVVDGGVLSFDAILPGTNNPVNFNACWRVTDGPTYVPFDKIRLSGYYPRTDIKGSQCYGNPWVLQKKNTKTDNKDTDYQTKIEFEINIPMNK
jgi:hypothetical protein